MTEERTTRRCAAGGKRTPILQAQDALARVRPNHARADRLLAVQLITEAGVEFEIPCEAYWRTARRPRAGSELAGPLARPRGRDNLSHGHVEQPGSGHGASDTSDADPPRDLRWWR